MMKFDLKSLVFAALCVAIGIVLPQFFHSVPNAGSVFLPMHIPVLLCGFLCAWPYALLCGIVTPVLSHFITGMPPTAVLPAMVCELAVYGLVSALLFRFVRPKNLVVRTYIALVGAMLAGRLVAGILKALIFNVGKYSLNAWVTSSFVTALPGIVILLVLIPAIVVALARARVLAVK